MNRRKFVYAALATGSLPLMGQSPTAGFDPAASGEFFEIRTYELRFGGAQQILREYLETVLGPALKEKGASQFRIFVELGKMEPARLWTMTAYPDLPSFARAQNLPQEEGFQKQASAYLGLEPQQASYTRVSSFLLSAFEGMPVWEDPGSEAGLFELRIYEGYNEDAVRRKIRMFNSEEIALFHKTGLNPVFFGEMLVGPYLPCLTYLLSFKDMEERDANWKTFGAHPEWKAMSAKEEYANSVSNIRKIFLEPA